MWLTSGKTYSDLVSNANSFVTVGDTGNPAYSGTVGVLGNVDYTYQISKYEITHREYVLFLNSVDPFGIDPNDIYDPLIGRGIFMDNTRVAGYRYYLSDEVFNNKPVTYISFSRAVRFCNWLHNGGKRYKVSDYTATAPQNIGAYNIGVETINYVAPINNATFRLPTYSEWFKAAYYNGSGAYNSYATQSNIAPGQVSAYSNGDGYYQPLNLLSNLELDILTNNNSQFNVTNNNISNLQFDILRNDISVHNRISNLELDILSSNNNNNGITNNHISNLQFDILSNNLVLINNIMSYSQFDILCCSPPIIYNSLNSSSLQNDIFLSTTNSKYLENIITYHNYDILTSSASSYSSNLSNFQIDILSSNKTINTQILMLNIDCLCSENKKYLINSISVYDVLCNKKS
jgi:hypothetical protein